MMLLAQRWLGDTTAAIMPETKIWTLKINFISVYYKYLLIKSNLEN